MRSTADRIGYTAGVTSIVLGGLTASATGPLRLAKGSWLSAYLVLICGAAQCLTSSHTELLDRRSTSQAPPWVRLATWNTGNALVITGALSSRPVVANAGGPLLLVSLLVAALDTRGATRRRQALVARAIYGLLAASVPIGLTLTRRGA